MRDMERSFKIEPVQECGHVGVKTEGDFGSLSRQPDEHVDVRSDVMSDCSFKGGIHTQCIVLIIRSYMKCGIYRFDRFSLNIFY